MSDSNNKNDPSGPKPEKPFGRRDPGDPRTQNAFNMGRPSIAPMYADGGWMDRLWYDAAREDPAWPEVHTYTDEMTYAPGETVVFRTSTYAKEWSIEIVRDGLKPESVYKQEGLAGHFHPAPKDCYKNGCHWPESHSWSIPKDTRSGFFKVISTCLRPDGSRYVQFHFFVVRPTPATQTAKLLMLLPTATWSAYNDWGGSNAYYGIDGEPGDQFSPSLSLQRPWSRGMVWLPEGAPRICNEWTPQPLTAPRYTMKDWAWSHGFTFFYAAAGWAQYDRHFAVWAEGEGIAFDMITQTDLHYRPEILELYKSVVVVGHDEYWTREMRENMEAFVERGGKLARFAGNFLWQIRLEDDGRRQIAYKSRALTEDPVRGTDKANLLTDMWDSKGVNWPSANTVGVSGLQGIYASWGGFAPRNSKGFTVYRADHWVFNGTNLCYSDIFGHEAQIFAYEVDGLDYTFRRGLPYPTGDDGSPTDIKILAMSLAVNGEGMFGEEGVRYYMGDNPARGLARRQFGNEDPESIERNMYGSGMLVHMERGKGEVVTAGTCEWIMGLKRNDFFTTKITLNVLERFTA